MADYAPIHSRWSSTATTSAAVTAGQLVVVSGSGTVAPSAGADVAWLGVAGYDAASGEILDVEHGGTQRLIAAGAIAAGDQVISAADGKVATAGAVTAGIVGVARTTAADGAAVEVQMER